MFFSPQKLSLLRLTSGKKILAPTTNNERSLNDSYDYVPPKVIADILPSFCCFFSYEVTSVSKVCGRMSIISDFIVLEHDLVKNRV